MFGESTYYKFDTNTIYFSLNELVTAAGKKRTKEEYQTALDAINNYRWLGIKSSLLKTVQDGKEKFVNEAIGIIQHFTIVGGIKKGRKKSSDADQTGRVKVVFSDYTVNNLRSSELSIRLNFSFMMRLSSPLAKRYFRLLNALRSEREPHNEKIFVLDMDIKQIANLIPIKLMDYNDLWRFKRTVDPIHQEFRDMEFIRKWEYKRENSAVKVAWYFSEYSAEQAVVYMELLKRGVSQSAASKTALTKEPEEVMDYIRYFDIKKREKTCTPGFLVKIINNPDHDLIKTYLKDYGEKQKHVKREEAYLKEGNLQMMYQQDQDSSAENYLKKLNSEEKKEILRAANERVQNRKYITKKSRDIAVDLEMKSIIAEKMRFPSFEEWRKRNEKNLDVTLT